MRRHEGLTGQCTHGCMCGGAPVHRRTACGRPCRFCLIEDKDSTTEIQECKKHCQLHRCVVEKTIDHERCLEGHEKCPSCQGRHWYQDCPDSLKNVCPMQSCRDTLCAAHCRECGGPVDWNQVIGLCPKEWEANSEVWKPRINGLFRKWHTHLHAKQWTRLDVPDGDIKKDAWCKLRCRSTTHHYEVTADELSKLRATAWGAAIRHIMQLGYEEGGRAKAVEVLAAPECRMCWAMTYQPTRSGDFETRQPGGGPSAWGKEFLMTFDDLQEAAP
ncbi:hypothetical protein F5883DRAFT_649064 [Diaporthe sp. PMI_573]|nr:hypothetical protein F5883DRAFT_649064 [Diaporthaceae sp. PMI_573]